MKHPYICQLVLCACLAIPWHGQSAIPSQEPSVVSLFGNYTLAAVRLNFRRADPAATIDWLLTLAPVAQREALRKEADRLEAQFDVWLKPFRSHGVEELFIAFDLKDLGRHPMLIVASADDGLLQPEVQRHLKSFMPKLEPAEGRTLRGLRVMADSHTLDRLQSPDHLPDAAWASLFKSIPDGSVQVAVKPYPEWERVLKEVLPTLPEILGGGPSTALTQGLVSGWISLATPPDPAVHLRIHSGNRAGADALLDVVQAGLDLVDNHEEFQRTLPNWSALRDALTPAVLEDGLDLSLTDEEMALLINEATAGMISEAHGVAHRNQSMNNLRQIGQACRLYAEDHGGETPEHFVSLLPYLELEYLVHPAYRAEIPKMFEAWSEIQQRDWIDEYGSYRYVCPGKNLRRIDSPGRVFLAHEKSGPDPRNHSVAAVFADGHVEVLRSAEELASRLQRDETSSVR